MPNLVHNHLVLTGDEAVVAWLLDRVVADVSPPDTAVRRVLALVGRRTTPVSGAAPLLETLCPVPDEPVDPRDIDGFTGALDRPWDWWWRVAYWGTADDLVLDGRSVVHREPGEVHLSFVTTYAPPVTAVRTGGERLGFGFELEWCGGEFCGLATPDGDQEWELPYDRPAQDVGIPRRLVDRFGLHDRYLET